MWLYDRLNDEFRINRYEKQLKIITLPTIFFDLKLMYVTVKFVASRFKYKGKRIYLQAATLTFSS